MSGLPAGSLAIPQDSEAYYPESNRIILFYGDVEVSGEYTKVGYFDFIDEFREAAEDNPVFKEWGNKIVLINSKD